MRFLLDTHVLIWWLLGEPTLAIRAAAARAEGAQVHVSPVSVWEIGIKRALGKLDAPPDLSEVIGHMRELPVTWRHASVAASLPPHHRDPFDRMLVAQAQVEGLTLVTSDERIGRYDVRVLDAS
jgi:PIN domain nuclease of toxin-antitoxin system